MISGHAPNRTCRTFLGPTPWNKNILRTFGHLGWYLMAVRGPLVRHLGLVPSGDTWTRQRAGFRPSRGLPRDLLECGLGSAADYIVLLPSFRTSTQRQGGHHFGDMEKLKWRWTSSWSPRRTFGDDFVPFGCHLGAVRVVSLGGLLALRAPWGCLGAILGASGVPLGWAIWSRVGAIWSHPGAV